MFHPVGSQPQSVYWRRRFLLLASVFAVLVLLALTVRVALSSAPAHSAAGAGKPAPTRPATSPTPPPPPSSTTHGSSAAPRSSTAVGKPSPDPSSSAPAPCTPSELALAAVTGQSSYQVGDQPVLSIEVTNSGPTACVVDLADPQIMLSVYNGESRVWGSHDCKIQPGTDDRTLMAGRSVRVSIVWSGLSSQPNCAGTRQRVGAGTYTLYASLAGHQAKAAQFTIG